MTSALRVEVRQRAGDRCEYCQLPQASTALPHETDHIRSQKHGGPTSLDNLCWACARCNDFKGSDVAAYDPMSNELVRLFSPRTDAWGDHFHWQGHVLMGQTIIGRATVELLKINLPERIEHRRLLSTTSLPVPDES